MNINEARFERFTSAYAMGLTAAVRADPESYPWAKSQVDIERVAEKMSAAVRAGSYNKDGQGFINTCRVLGIKHTYQAINAYLRGEL